MATRSEVVIIKNALPAAASQVEDNSRQILAKIVFDIVAETKRNIVAMHAVDTGNMLNTTDGEMIDDMNGEARVPAEYSAYVHDGYDRPDGGHTAGRPFMSKAVETVKADIPLAFTDLIKV